MTMRLRAAAAAIILACPMTTFSVPTVAQPTLPGEPLPYESLSSIAIARTDAAGAIVECKDMLGLRWCGKAEFDLPRMAQAMTGPLPPSSRVIRTMVFKPGDAPLPPPRAASPTSRQLYAGSARVTIASDGKLASCTENARPGDRENVLCPLAGTWPFGIAPDGKGERTGLWTVTLASAPR